MARSIQEITDTVFDIVSDMLAVDRDKITRESRFETDLGANSLDTVELIMEFEEEFDISIPDDVAERMVTVGKAIDLIHGLAPK